MPQFGHGQSAAFLRWAQPPGEGGDQALVGGGGGEVVGVDWTAYLSTREKAAT